VFIIRQPIRYGFGYIRSKDVEWVSDVILGLKVSLLL
jgi:hypothetical protein